MEAFAELDPALFEAVTAQVPLEAAVGTPEIKQDELILSPEGRAGVVVEEQVADAPRLLIVGVMETLSPTFQLVDE